MSVAVPELLVGEGFEHPEGIVWDGSGGRLVWVDIFKGHVVSYDLKSGGLERIEVGQPVGSVAPRREGGFVCALREGFGTLSPEGELTVLAAPLRDVPNMQMNDGAVDPLGRFWAGSMTFEYETRPGVCSLYRVDPDGSVSEQLTGVSVSNGIGWSPDGSSCYYCDSATERVDRFDFDLHSGTLGTRSTLAEVLGVLPDGLAVDADGCVWVAIWGGSEVRRLTPDGRVDRVVPLPGAQVATCAFGDDDLRTLFISVSPHGLGEDALREQQTGIFALDPGVQGLPGQEFLG